MDKLKVFVAEDHTIVAEGFKSLLLELPEVAEVEHFTNGQDLYRACLSHAPNIVFLDIEMPVWNGIKTLRELQLKGFTFPIVILSMLEERSIISQCIEIGASGYLHKDAAKEELAACIKAVFSGEQYLSNEAAKILSGERKPKFFKLDDNKEIILTEREKEILGLICEGLSSREIGEKLFISSRTVETHKEHLLDKFEVNSTAKLIASSIRRKIIS